MVALPRNCAWLVSTWILVLSGTAVGEAVPYTNVTYTNHTTTNHTRPYEPAGTISHNQLSWQSAFWATVAIALTTMADPPGRIYGFSNELTFFLKLSPLTCLVDVVCSVNMIVELGSRPMTQRSDKGVMHQVAMRKLDGSDNIADVPRNPIRLILFVLGALPQAIKLYSCGGIILSQVNCTCYLASFMLDEILFLVVWRDKHAPNTATRAIPKYQTMVTWALIKLRSLCYDFRFEVGYSFLIALLPKSYGIFETDLRSDRWSVWLRILFCTSSILILLATYVLMRIGEYRRLRKLRSVQTTVPVADQLDSSTVCIWNPVVSATMSITTLASMMHSVLGIFMLLLNPSNFSRPDVFCCAFSYGLLTIVIVHSVQEVRPNKPDSRLERELRCSCGVALFMLASLSPWAMIHGGAALAASGEYWTDPAYRPLLLVGVLLSATFALYTGRWGFRLLLSGWWITLPHELPLVSYCCFSAFSHVTYYRYEYDATSTVKPAWTDWLG